MRVQTESGKMLTLIEDAPAKEGGRGRVYDIEGSSLICKVLSPHYRTKGREAKIKREIEIAQKDKGRDIAWPVESVYLQDQWIGFTMPKIEGVGLDQVSRSAVSFSSRVGIAYNCACIVARVQNRYRIVLGDNALANFLYSYDTKRVTLIDPDSFQVVDPQAKLVYSTNESREKSPEMAGKILGDFILSPSSDDYLLAIMIFQLLFFGAHPLDDFRSDMPPAKVREENAAAHRFPYLDLEGSLPVFAAGQKLEQLFFQSFRLEKPPSAAEYAVALKVLLEGGFTECRECGHEYPSELNCCPACGRRAVGFVQNLLNRWHNYVRY